MNRVIKKSKLKTSKDIVVFVHGFGVRYDSRGMFTDLEENLPKDWGYVLFDLYEVSGNAVYVTQISDQIKKLNKVIDDVKDEFKSAKIHVIAHSKGCVVTALAMPKVEGKIVLLAPPETFGKNLQDYFEKYPGAKKTNDCLIIPRKDGTITHISDKYFQESMQIQPDEEILKLSNQRKVIIFQTTEDEVIGLTSYSKLQGNSNIKIIPIKSDHNFTGDNRRRLINQLKELLK